MRHFLEVFGARWLWPFCAKISIPVTSAVKTCTQFLRLSVFELKPHTGQTDRQTGKTDGRTDEHDADCGLLGRPYNKTNWLRQQLTEKRDELARLRQIFSHAQQKHRERQQHGNSISLSGSIYVWKLHWRVGSRFPWPSTYFGISSKISKRQQHGDTHGDFLARVGRQTEDEQRQGGHYHARKHYVVHVVRRLVRVRLHTESCT